MYQSKWSYAIIILMTAVLFSIVGRQKASAQWLYYPANAMSLYGQPSILIIPPITPTTGGLPINYSSPVNTLAPVLPIASTAISSPINVATATSGVSLLSSIYNPLSIMNPLSTLPLLSSVTSTAITPPTDTNFLYYAPGTVPGLPITPPISAGVGTLPYNLYYPPGTAPGIPILPPLGASLAL